MHKTTSTVLISLLNTCNFSTFSLMLCKEGLKRKGSKLYLLLSFSVIIFSVSNWLIQGHKWERKDIIGPWLFMFLRKPLPSLCLRDSDSNIKHGLSGLRVSTSAYSDIQVTCFESCWTPTYHRFTWILCMWGIADAMYEWNSKEQRAHLHVSAHYMHALSPHRLHLAER